MIKEIILASTIAISAVELPDTVTLTREQAEDIAQDRTMLVIEIHRLKREIYEQKLLIMKYEKESCV